MPRGHVASAPTPTAWRKNIAFKLSTYYEGWLAERHVQQFGVKQLRVVVLTNSEARMRNMLVRVGKTVELMWRLTIALRSSLTWPLRAAVVR